MITEPLIIEKDRQTFSTPNLIEFEPKIETTDSITTWNLEITQTGNVLRSFSGTNTPGKIQWNVQPNELKQSNVPVDYTLVVENKGGKQSMKSGTIPVEYLSYNRKKVEDKPDKVISKYSLVVFDFDSPEVSEKDKEILKKNVIPSINYNSVIQIYGYTDRIGDDSYNQKLALRRAESVKKFLEPYTKSNKIEVYGIGENIEIFDNDLPIGRQLSRTVQIYVITPKEK
jgi:outer membrane protein OmpA-like peptidoglycan-associated protein